MDFVELLLHKRLAHVGYLQVSVDVAKEAMPVGYESKVGESGSDLSTFVLIFELVWAEHFELAANLLCQIEYDEQ